MSRSPTQTRDRWRQRMERFHDAGLTVARFRRQENVSTASFYAWRNKLAGRRTAAAGGEDPASGKQTSAFREVTVAEACLAPAGFVAVLLPGGARLEIPTADGQTLELALRTIAACDAAAARGETPC